MTEMAWVESPENLSEYSGHLSFRQSSQESEKRTTVASRPIGKVLGVSEIALN